MANPLSWLWRKKKKESTILVPKTEPDINTLYPNGFFRVLNVANKSAGLGFWCRRCKLHVPHSAPPAIFHCGALDTLDPKANLPTVRLNNPNLSFVAGRTFIDPDEWDGAVGYDGNGGHPKTSDPFAGGVGFGDSFSARGRK